MKSSGNSRRGSRGSHTPPLPRAIPPYREWVPEADHDFVQWSGDGLDVSYEISAFAQIEPKVLDDVLPPVHLSPAHISKLADLMGAVASREATLRIDGALHRYIVGTAVMKHVPHWSAIEQRLLKVKSGIDTILECFDANRDVERRTSLSEGEITRAFLSGYHLDAETLETARAACLDQLGSIAGKVSKRGPKEDVSFRLFLCIIVDVFRVEKLSLILGTHMDEQVQPRRMSPLLASARYLLNLALEFATESLPASNHLNGSDQQRALYFLKRNAERGDRALVDQLRIALKETGR